MWAMSTMKYASTSRAMAAMRSKSMTRGYALAPPTMSLGRTSLAIRSTSS